MTSRRVQAIAREFAQWRAEQEASHVPNLFDTIESVTENAGSYWTDHALEAVRRAARELELFTVDDVVPYITEPTIDRRALGGVMLVAARQGIAESTGEYRTSSRRETHSRPLRLWRSLLSRSGPTGQANGQIATKGRQPLKVRGPDLYADLGLDRRRVAEARLLASVYPDTEIQARVQQANADARELSRGELLRAARKTHRETP